MRTNLFNNLKRLYLLSDQLFHKQSEDGARYFPLKALPDESLQQHCNGEITLALNLVSSRGLTRTLVIDFDGVAHGQGEAHLDVLKQLYKALTQELELPEPAVSISGRKGFGLWISLAEPIPAAQAQAFLQSLEAVYLSDVSSVDLRPDCAEPTTSGQAVIKLPPCLHRSNNKWSAFIRIEEAELYLNTPWLETAPDLEQQAKLLESMQSIDASTFFKAFNAISNKVELLGLSKTKSEPHAPDFSKAPNKEYLPPCIKTLVEQGVPEGMNYHTANLNLVNYCYVADLTEEHALKLAVAMSNNTSEEGRSKSKKERIDHFKSIQPKGFYCNYPRTIEPWKKAYGGNTACQRCPLNVKETLIKNKEVETEESTETKNGTLLKALILRKEVALDLIKYAWEHGVDISHIQGVLPLIKIPYKFNFKINSKENEPKERDLTLDWFKLVASISNKKISNADFFYHLEIYIHNHCSYSYVKTHYQDKSNTFLIETEENSGKIYFIEDAPRELALKYTQTFFNDIHSRNITKQQGEDALKYAEEAAAKYKLLNTALSCAFNPHDSTSGLIAKVGETLNAISKHQVKEAVIKEQKQTLFFEIFKPRLSVETPFNHLNYKLEGGFQAGRMYVLIATPKSGKTTFAANCMDYAAANGHPVLYLGYEMGKAQLMLYGLSRKTEINAAKIQAVRLNEEEQNKVLEAFNAYADNEGKYLTLVEAGDNYTFANAVAWVCLNNNIEINGKIPFLVIDYLQIAFSGKKEVDQNVSASERVGHLAVMCKRIAREHKVALLVLSSVTKMAENDSNNKGRMDITAARDSLAIIHAADGVMTLQSNSITLKQGKGKDAVENRLDPWEVLADFCEENGNGTEAQQIRKMIQNHYPHTNENVRAVLYLERHRGSTGQIPLYYKKAIHKFEEVALSNNHKNFYEKGDATRLLEKADALFSPTKNSDIPDEKDTQLQLLFSDSNKPTEEEPLTINKAVSAVIETIEYIYITDISAALAEIEKLQEIVALDLETTGLDPITSQIRLISLYDGNKTLIIDAFKIGSIHTLGQSLKQKKLVGHNSIFDMQFLKQAGVDVLMDCTMIGHHVLSGEQKSLKDLAKTYLEIEMSKEEQQSDWKLENLSTAQLQYAASDVVRTFEIWSKIKHELKENEFVRIYKAVRDAQPAVVQMQLTGIFFDKNIHSNLILDIKGRKSQLQEILKDALNGKSHTSTKQLGEWLTEQLGGKESTNYKKWEKTGKTQLKTGADELKKYAYLLPEGAKKVVEEALIPIKDLEKQLSSFGVSLANKLNPITERIHPSFNLTGARTGRASCREPNLQQIPRGKAFRELFLPRQDSVFIIADYSQIELRVAAEIAGETNMLEDFKNGRDIHRSTASMLLNKNYEEVPANSEMRNAAKALNFGMLYGMGTKGLQSYAEQGFGVKISEKQAKQYITSFFEGYPNINAWQQKVKNTTQKSLAISTPLGRIRRWNRTEFKTTEALNTPVQAGAAEIMLLALARLYEHLKPFNAKILAFIHDEIIVECLEPEASSVLEVIKEQMTQAVLDMFPNAAVNGLVDAKIAKNWGEK